MKMRLDERGLRPSDPEAIVRGVPIPPLPRPKSRELLLVAELRPGDCRWIARPADRTSDGFRAAISSACIRTFGKGNYTVRTEGAGIRVWRKE